MPRGTPRMLRSRSDIQRLLQMIDVGHEWSWHTEVSFIRPHARKLRLLAFYQAKQKSALPFVLVYPAQKAGRDQRCLLSLDGKQLSPQYTRLRGSERAALLRLLRKHRVLLRRHWQGRVGGSAIFISLFSQRFPSLNWPPLRLRQGPAGKPRNIPATLRWNTPYFGVHR